MTVWDVAWRNQGRIRAEAMHLTVEVQLATARLDQHDLLTVVAVRWRRSARREALLPDGEALQAVL
jgi:hypothetical protein